MREITESLKLDLYQKDLVFACCSSRRKCNILCYTICIKYSERFILTKVYTAVYTIFERKVIIMMTAKVFENGRSQAIRLPKECRFSSDEVMVNKIGDIVMLIPKKNKWDSFMIAIDMFSDDFMADGRASDTVQEREEL